MTIPLFFVRLLILVSVLPAFQLAADSLEADFKNPPASARPKTWMHSMSGNMSREGLTKDLEAIADAGIGGVLLFHVSHSIPRGKVIFNSPEHLELVGHAAMECERLGLSLGVHNCDGWTSSGGPWIAPEQSMKMLVWSETMVEGGKALDLILDAPTAREGYYEDVATIAYPTLPAEIEDASNQARVSASHASFDVGIASDGRWDRHSVLPSSVAGDGWLQFSYEQAKEVRSLHMALTKTISGSRDVDLLSSDDGETFEKRLSFTLKRLGKREFAVEESFTPLKARHFRIVIHDDCEVQEVSLTARKNFEDFIARSSLLKVEDERLTPLEDSREGEAIQREQIVDLSEQLDSEGRLRARLPAGRWTVLRFGMTTTAAVNSPASDEGRGLEVDKMSKSSLDIHYNEFVKNVVAKTKAVAPNALQYIQIDSFEVGGQNWTQGYEAIFEDTFGYDLISYLPLYAGRLVGNARESDAVLWDIRKLNSNLVTENYFGHFAALVHGDGMIAYTEPYSFNGPFSELDAGKYADRTMGEFWMHQRYQTETAVSSGRIYGKSIISSEAFSAGSDINWRGHPGLSKLTGDKAWVLGINEFMFHRFAHQANTHVLPGMTMSQWGSHVDRTQIWWESAGKAWFQYIARGSHLLRQGLPSSDLLVFVGEGNPNSAVGAESLGDDLPWQVNFDSINADALLNRISGDEGKLVLPEGTSYKLLLLRNSQRMSLAVLEKLKELSDAGCIIVGDTPDAIARPFPTAGDRETFDRLVKTIWNRSKTYSKFDLKQIYREQGLAFDMTVLGEKELSYVHRTLVDRELYFFANRSGETARYECSFEAVDCAPEIWYPMNGAVLKTGQYFEEGGRTIVTVDLAVNESAFVVLKKGAAAAISVVKIESPEDAEFSAFLSEDKELMLHAGEMGDYALLLSDGDRRTVRVSDIPGALTLADSWTVHFRDPFGDTFSLEGARLGDWAFSSESRIQHFSGTAEYRTTFTVDQIDLESGLGAVLSLGEVGVVAEVTLNGIDLGTVWLAPFDFDISTALRQGENVLCIQVSNTWTNRLIGDESLPRVDGYDQRKKAMPTWYTNNEPPPAGGRKTFTTYGFYNKSSPLERSGLLGPVQLRFHKVIKVGK